MTKPHRNGNTQGRGGGASPSPSLYAAIVAAAIATAEQREMAKAPQHPRTSPGPPLHAATWRQWGSIFLERIWEIHQIACVTWAEPLAVLARPCPAQGRPRRCT